MPGLIAITREVSPSIGACEVRYVERQAIDVARAVEQHRRYVECLSSLGVSVVTLPALPDLPDAVFVEDPAVVVDEIAVVTRMGAESRRAESQSVADALAGYRPVRWIDAPGTLEGGDVLRAGRMLFVGISHRTNPAGIGQLAAHLTPLGYHIKPVPLRHCLHLKTAACYLGNRTILANPEWVDVAQLEGCRVVEIVEPFAANVLTIGDTVIMPDCFPETRAIVEGLGWKVRTLDVSELMKAEAGVTCMSLLFTAASGTSQPS
jgi:dimethylargininase